MLFLLTKEKFLSLNNWLDMDAILSCLFTYVFEMVKYERNHMNLANALAKCLHSPLIGHALQFGLLFVQNT